MSKHDDCRECQAGLKQALSAHIGWTCMVHGPDYIDVQQMTEAVINLRTENVQLRDALLAMLEPAGDTPEEVRAQALAAVRKWGK